MSNNTTSLSSDLKYLLFTKTVTQIFPMDEKVLEKIYSDFVYTEMEKNQFFAQQGSISSSFAFIAEGLFKISFVDEEGNEYIKYFLTPSDVLLGNLMENERSNISIQALKKSAVFKIDYGRLNSLIEKYAPLNQMKTLLISKYWDRKEKREMELMSNEAKRNYELFLEKYAHLENDLSQYHIAQYLGITPTQLSRVKKSLS